MNNMNLYKIVRRIVIIPVVVPFLIIIAIPMALAIALCEKDWEGFKEECKRFFAIFSI